MTIICFDRIEIGENVLVSWDTLVMDNDFHDIIDLSTHRLFGKTGHIAIGNNCWICYGATILKNTIIGNGCIISAKSLAKGNYPDENAILGGVPAKIIKRDCTRIL